MREDLRDLSLPSLNSVGKRGHSHGVVSMDQPGSVGGSDKKADFWLEKISGGIQREADGVCRSQVQCQIGPWDCSLLAQEATAGGPATVGDQCPHTRTSPLG